MGLPTIAVSTVVYQGGSTYTSVKVTLGFTGTITFYVCADGATETWEEVTGLTTAIEQVYVFTTTGGEIKWKAIGSTSSTITSIQLIPQV